MRDTVVSVAWARAVGKRKKSECGFFKGVCLKDQRLEVHRNSQCDTWGTGVRDSIWPQRVSKTLGTCSRY